MGFEWAEVPTCNRCVWRPKPLDDGGGFTRLSTSQGCPVHEPPRPFPTEQCRSPRCGKTIVWAKTEAMRDSPVEAEPAPDGNLELYWDGPIPRCRVLRTAQAKFGKTLYQSHFTTCRDAERWRKR